MATKNPDSKRPVGTKAFRVVWEKTATQVDNWGVNCVYDFDGWEIWKAAVRHERKRAGKGKAE